MLAKWTQVIASVFLVLVSSALLIRDWKFHDKRTKAHHTFTTILFFISLISAGALGWSMWKNFPEPEPQPSLRFYLNGKQMINGAILPIIVTNRSQALEISVQNSGSANAELLTINALVDQNIIQPTAGWSEGPAGFDIVENELKPRTKISNFQIQGSGLLEQSCFFLCPAFSIRDNIVMPFKFPLAVVAAAKGKCRYAVYLTLEISLGTKTR